MRQLPLWMSDLALVVSTSARGLADDPLQFLLQVARRLRLLRPPKNERPTLLNSYRWYLADRTDVAGRLIACLQPRRGVRRRLARRLKVQLGLDRANEDDSPRLRWLDRTQVGDLTGALEVVDPKSAAGRRTASELRLLRPFPASPPSPVNARRSVEDGHRALFVLTNSVPYTKSGYTYRSHSILKALDAAGVHVEASTRIGYPTTVGLPGRPASWTVDGIRYHRLASPRLPLAMDDRLEAQRRLLVALAGKVRPTVLHCTTDYTNAVVTRGAAADLGLPWVYEMRGQLEQTWVASRPPSLQSIAADSERVRLLRAKEAELASEASAVIVLSEVQRQDLIERGVSAEQIHVVPNAVDASLLDEARSPGDARAELGLPAEGFWVGSVSSIVDYEGFDVLLRAVRHARDAGLDVRCALVGDGVSRPGLVGFARELGLQEHVVMPGRVSPSVSRIWYQALDAFVVPRRDTRVTRLVTPLKPIEAMALARPVLASDLPALAELVSGPGSGLLFPAGDGPALAERIAQVAADPDRRAALAGNGRALARGRTWQNAAESITSIYDKECSGEVR